MAVKRRTQSQGQSHRPAGTQCQSQTTDPESSTGRRSITPRRAVGPIGLISEYPGAKGSKMIVVAAGDGDPRRLSVRPADPFQPAGEVQHGTSRRDRLAGEGDAPPERAPAAGAQRLTDELRSMEPAACCAAVACVMPISAGGFRARLDASADSSLPHSSSRPLDSVGSRSRVDPATSSLERSSLARYIWWDPESRPGTDLRRPSSPEHTSRPASALSDRRTHPHRSPGRSRPVLGEPLGRQGNIRGARECLRIAVRAGIEPASAWLANVCAAF